MNPAIAALLLEAEQKGLALGIQVVQKFLQDIIGGKSITDSLNDIGDSIAETQAVALDEILSPGP